VVQRRSFGLLNDPTLAHELFQFIQFRWQKIGEILDASFGDDDHVFITDVKILLRHTKLHDATWFQRAAMGGIALPFLACFAGWILTETGRQPWIVWGLQKTADAVSPTSTTAMLTFSLVVLVLLYAVLGVLDFWLMRRYARLDPPAAGGESEGGAPVSTPAPSY